MKKSNIRLAAVASAILAIESIGFSTVSYFILPKPEEKLNAFACKELLEAYRIHIFVLLPFLSSWLVWTAVVLWRCSGLASTGAQNGSVAGDNPTPGIVEAPTVKVTGPK
jgi:hypothetical protein